MYVVDCWMRDLTWMNMDRYGLGVLFWMRGMGGIRV